MFAVDAAESVAALVFNAATRSAPLPLMVWALSRVTVPVVFAVTAAKSAAFNVPVASLTTTSTPVSSPLARLKFVVIDPPDAKFARLSVIVPEYVAVIPVTFAIFPATSAVISPETVALDAAPSVTASVINAAVTSLPVPLMVWAFSRVTLPVVFAVIRLSFAASNVPVESLTTTFTSVSSALALLKLSDIAV